MRLSTIKYILLFLAQAVLWNYFNFSQYLLVVFLPVMILCLPLEKGPVHAMLVAFVTGLAADFFVTGQLGLTSLALVPVGLVRRVVVRLVFGSEPFSRGENLSFHRQGWQKFVPCVLIVTAVFLLIHISVDSAGMYPFGFRALKFGISLLVSSAVSVAIAFVLLEETGERWK